MRKDRQTDSPHSKCSQKNYYEKCRVCGTWCFVTFTEDFHSRTEFTDRNINPSNVYGIADVSENRVSTMFYSRKHLLLLSRKVEAFVA